ncbi:hypothetical protein VA596_44865 [Amycolatopsis sp., V23-08]|uniref:Uncharacterized protein n=1 Tax=Amycolatopsis heterodermiae TaxID=3110235 RepID=A0ABU5RMK4_9PSEU|nr:hypothetical protein [Amycolatopsis sp., V23-08]MEA5366730.1 hypothetical protein [Amycolatopsis sp., V23-08]
MSCKQAVLSALALLVVPVLVLVCRPVPKTGTPDTLRAEIAAFTGALSASQPYRPPDASERATAARGFADLDSLATKDLAKLGFTVEDLVDPVTRRPYTLVRNEPGTARAWGMFLLDRSAPPSLAVEVPHPAFDLRTELFGLDLWRRTPGAVLMIAGAHRRADGDRADVAHEAGSVFQVVAAGLVGRGLAQVQLHGFDDASAPGYDIVLSPGSGRAGGAAVRLGDDFGKAGFAVCRAWLQVCAGLEGETNVQGRLAETAGTAFLHVEMNRTLRDADASRARAVQALVDAQVGRP